MQSLRNIDEFFWLKLQFSKGYLVEGYELGWWKSLTSLLFIDCPATLRISLPVVSGPLTCNLGSSCSLLTCCLYAEPLAKHVTMFLNLDFCHDKMTVGIDRFSEEMRLSTYQYWGMQNNFILIIGSLPCICFFSTWINPKCFSYSYTGIKSLCL